MLITKLDNDGAEFLKNKHDGSFPFPNIDNPAIVSKQMVIAEGQIIGAGLLRVTSEAILLMDKEAPLHLRVSALMALITELKAELESKGLEDCHAFVREPNVLKFLEACGFQLSVSGTPMVYIK